MEIMHLKQLSIVNFKNLAGEDFDFHPALNVLLGNNGQGKTNVLDAIHYLSMSKSCFNSVDSQNITHGESFFMVQGHFEHADAITEIYCGIKKGQKKILRKNKKDYEKLADHIGLFPLVMISPADSDLINEGSSTRRRFMDSVISQFDKQYLEYMIAYNKVLEQRNSLLRMTKGKPLNVELLEVYNHQLAPLGEKIYEKRKEFLKGFVPLFNSYFKKISSAGNEEAEITYQTKLHDERLVNLLEKNFDADRVLEYTTCGIHKDDLEFKLNGYPVKKYGSQGQQKSFVIALKIAQHAFIKSVKDFSPLLLLDDIFDKLDNNRVNFLLQMVTQTNFGQVFITDTDSEKIPRILGERNIDAVILKIVSGKKCEATNQAMNDTPNTNKKEFIREDS